MMEISDNNACHIHGIIYSDSDSEGNSEFDEDYMLLKPPPYDYEAIKHKVVVISKKNNPKLAKPFKNVKNIKATKKQLVNNADSINQTRNVGITNNKKIKYYFTEVNKKSDIHKHIQDIENNTRNVTVGPTVKNVPVTVKKHTTVCKSGHFPGETGRKEKKMGTNTSKSIGTRGNPWWWKPAKEKAKRKEKSVTHQASANKQKIPNSQNPFYSSKTLEKAEQCLDGLQKVWHSGHTAMDVQQTLDQFRKKEIEMVNCWMKSSTQVKSRVTKVSISNKFEKCDKTENGKRKEIKPLKKQIPSLTTTNKLLTNKNTIDICTKPNETTKNKPNGKKKQKSENVLVKSSVNKKTDMHKGNGIQKSKIKCNAVTKSKLLTETSMYKNPLSVPCGVEVLKTDEKIHENRIQMKTEFKENSTSEKNLNTTIEMEERSNLPVDIDTVTQLSKPRDNISINTDIIATLFSDGTTENDSSTAVIIKNNYLIDEEFRDFIHNIVYEGTNISDLGAFTPKQLYNVYMSYKQKKKCINSTRSSETLEGENKLELTSQTNKFHKSVSMNKDTTFDDFATGFTNSMAVKENNYIFGGDDGGKLEQLTSQILSDPRENISMNMDRTTFTDYAAGFNDSIAVNENDDLFDQDFKYSIQTSAYEGVGISNLNTFTYEQYDFYPVYKPKENNVNAPCNSKPLEDGKQLEKFTSQALYDPDECISVNMNTFTSCTPKFNSSLTTAKENNCLFDDEFKYFLQNIAYHGVCISDLSAFTYEQLYDFYMYYKQNKNANAVVCDDKARNFEKIKEDAAQIRTLANVSKKKQMNKGRSNSNRYDMIVAVDNPYREFMKSHVFEALKREIWELGSKILEQLLIHSVLQQF